MNGLRAEDPAGDDAYPGEMWHFPADDDTRLGDIMRGERATLGKSLLDVQRELRIRALYIAAIENCDITAFDTPSFVAGYVRSYARYLGLDPDWTFRRFCLESGFQPTHGMAPVAAGPQPSRRPSAPGEALANPEALFLPKKPGPFADIEPRAIGSLAVLIALVGALGYGGWAVLQEIQRVTLAPGEGAPGLSSPFDPAEGAIAAAPDFDMAAAVDPAAGLPQPDGLDRFYRPQVLEAPVLAARDGPIAAIDPGLGADSAAQAPGAADPVVAASAPATVLPATPVAGPPMSDRAAAPTTAAGDALAFELLAVRPAWIRVTAADGTVILEKIMDGGERFLLPRLEEPPLLRTGNAGAVYFVVGGNAYGPAAPGPQVVKNIKLSPADITAGYAPADLGADPELAQMVAVAQAQSIPADASVTD